MHETIIASSIIQEAKRHGDVEGVHLEIGELAHVPPEELMRCLRSLVDWDITFDEIMAHATCVCGFDGHPTVLERGHDSFMIECPTCKAMPQLESGTEIRLVNVRVK